MKQLTAIRLRTGRTAILTGIALVVLALLGGFAPSQARVAYGAAADIRVWLENDYDIYPSMDDVVFCVRAAHDCHALIYIVDTDGFIHVIHPFSPYESAWIEGGYTYRFTARDAGLYGFDSDRGIAFIYAIGSPVPFVYTQYGINIFAGRFAFRIYGDPFFACKRFYISLLPSWSNYSLVGVSYAHFYVRDWVRYPWYLCRHNGPGHRVNGRCAGCESIYARYRDHASDPYRILSPAVRYKETEGPSLYTTIASVPEKNREKILHERRIKPTVSKQPVQNILRKPAAVKSVAGTAVPARNASSKDKVVLKGKTVTRPVAPGKRPVQVKSDLKQTAALKKPAVVSKPAVQARQEIDKNAKIQSPSKNVVRSSKEMVKLEKSRTQALKKTVRSDSRVGHEETRAKTGASKTDKATKKADRTNKAGRQ